MENNETPVVVKGLRKSFGDRKVLDGIDVSIGRGETVAILGRSGTGKSVFLKLLIGLQKADAGSIQIEGEDITALNGDALNSVRKKIGFLFQQAALYDSLNVEENVGFPLSRHTKLAAAEKQAKVRELLASVGMEQEQAKMPSELSGGMQKRVGLARALALDPQILLFDEPTAGLDPITASEIGNLIAQQREHHQRTSIVVTHDLHGARFFSNRLIMVHEGRILIDGAFADLEKSKDEFVVRYLKEAI